MKWLRTASLILAPARLMDAAKNLLLWRRVRKDPGLRALWTLYFNRDYYLRAHADIARQGLDPQMHFLLCGNREYRDPSPGFSTRSYLSRYPEVAAGHINALLHFVLFGKREGRTAGGPAFAQFIPSRRGEATVAALSINNDWRREHPLLSVVIPCFNYGPFLETAIRSVLDQTFQDLEIIVVEGGSTDASTVEEVRRLESLGLQRTRFFYRTERHMAGDNRNFGIGMARGRYIVCLDPDDMLRSPYLEVAVFLAEAFGFDIVAPSVECHGESNLKWLLSNPFFPGILQENQISTVALFRRSAWAHVGGYRDWGVGKNYIPEDWDFWIRLLGHGCRGVAIREPLLYYRVHDQSLSHERRVATPEQRQKLLEANEQLWTAGPATNDPRFVMNPWTNLGPEPDAAPGFLLALPYITIGGAEKLFRTIVKAMRERGRRVVVITTQILAETTPDDAASFAGLTPHVYHLSRLFSDDEPRFGFLRYLLHRYAVETMMLAGCEFIYQLLPALTHEFPDLAVIDQLFNDSVHVPRNRLYSPYIDATVVPSEALRIALGGSREEMAAVHVIPHGIELPPEGEAAAILPEAAAGKIVVGFFGRFSSEKGPDLFVDIARRLAADSRFFFVMTGAGPESEAVLGRIRRYRLTNRIYTPGFVDNVSALMRAADIVVLPSRVDGMPLAVLEAQALGKPVVASRVGSLPSMIEDGATGFLCRPEDIEGFAKKILQLAGNPELREQMKGAAQRSVRSRFSSVRMLDDYERIFQTAHGAADEARSARV